MTTPVRRRRSARARCANVPRCSSGRSATHAPEGTARASPGSWAGCGTSACSRSSASTPSPRANVLCFCSCSAIRAATIGPGRGRGPRSPSPARARSSTCSRGGSGHERARLRRRAAPSFRRHWRPAAGARGWLLVDGIWWEAERAAERERARTLVPGGDERVLSIAPSGYVRNLASDALARPLPIRVSCVSATSCAGHLANRSASLQQRTEGSGRRGVAAHDRGHRRDAWLLTTWCIATCRAPGPRSRTCPSSALSSGRHVCPLSTRGAADPDQRAHWRVPGLLLEHRRQPPRVSLCRRQGRQLGARHASCEDRGGLGRALRGGA